MLPFVKNPSFLSLFLCAFFPTAPLRATPCMERGLQLWRRPTRVRLMVKVAPKKKIGSFLIVLLALVLSLLALFSNAHVNSAARLVASSVCVRVCLYHFCRIGSFNCVFLIMGFCVCVCVLAASTFRSCRTSQAAAVHCRSVAASSGKGKRQEGRGLESLFLGRCVFLRGTP